MEGFKRCRHANVAKTFSFQPPPPPLTPPSKTNYWSNVWREAVIERGRERDGDRLSGREWEGRRGGG